MRSLLLTLILFTQLSLLSQTPIIDHKIKSTVFGDERMIRIYVPETYRDTTMPIAVAYLFDGQFTPYLTMVSGMMEYYSQTDKRLPFMIVAIETNDRWKEFIPALKPGTEKDPAYSTPLSDYLEKEVFPYIESHYNTRPFRIGIGHSLGGTFLLYEVFGNTKHFDAVIMASPNTSQNDLVTFGPAFLDKNPKDETFIYIGAGTVDEMENEFRRSTELLDAAIKSRNPENFKWTYEKMEGRNHMSTFPVSFDKGYVALSRMWFPNESDVVAFKSLKGTELEMAVKECFERKTEFRNSEFPYTTDNLFTVINLSSRSGDHETALALTDLALAFYETDSTLSYPIEDVKSDLILTRNQESFSNLTSKAKALTESGKYKEAEELYLQAFRSEMLNGTYMERIESLEAFAQSGNKEEAFKQLKLLAEYFNLSDSKILLENKMLEPLHSDKRWDKYLKRIKTNVN